jgi:hypothetical protein
MKVALVGPFFGLEQLTLVERADPKPAGPDSAAHTRLSAHLPRSLGVTMPMPESEKTSAQLDDAIQAVDAGVGVANPVVLGANEGTGVAPGEAWVRRKSM